MKKCGKCGLIKPTSEFHQRGSSYQVMCKICRKLDDRARYQRNPRPKLARNHKRRQDMAEWAKTLKNGPCADCGQCYHYSVMDWDHVRGSKVANVAELVARAPSRVVVLAEIAKCELVCANCHRFRTFQRKENK